MTRPTIAILFGGCSEEHDVSVKSAVQVAAHLDRDRYEPVFVGITRAGAWLRCDEPRPDWQEGECRPAVLSPDRSTHGLLVSDGAGGFEPVHVDVVVPVLHGRFGEDGTVQGLLDLAGIPYVGCGLAASAICMDKSLAYVVARSAGIATPEFRVLVEQDDAPDEALGFPVFVKPARSGSSFGVTRVDHPDQLGAAIDEARRFDSKVLLERAVAGTEVGCAVLGPSDEPFVGEVDQITLRHGIFRIHQEDDPEHGSENAVVTVPAELSDGDRARVRDTAIAIYAALGCEGLARVDMFLCDDGQVVLNEVNTLPGFTSYSRYPRMMAASGVTGPELIDRLIDAAMER